MKPPLQITRPLGIALGAATLWVAFWLVAFRPVTPTRPVVRRPIARLSVARLSDIPDFIDPALFALPSRQGFSGDFPADRLNSGPRFTSPEQQQYFLEAGVIREGDPNPAPLYHTVRPVQTELPRPNAADAAPALPPGLHLSVSPELSDRATATALPELSGDLPAYARVHIRVEPNGTVSRCFFDTPPPTDALPAAVRSLRFAPAPHPVDSWIEIRSIPEKTSQ